MIQGAERVGTLAAELMEHISDASVEEGLTAQIRTVAIVCEVDVQPQDEDEPGWTQIRYRCSDPRRWVQRGFFDAAMALVDSESEARDDED